MVEPLDPAERPAEVPVLIVGGGPVGLTAAMLLARHGVASLLLERRGFTAHFPRAHLLNVRTMEVFHDVGVADDIYAAGPQDDDWRKVTWYTSVAGPTPLHGRKIGEVQAWGGGTDAPRYASASPRRFTNLPQIRLDRLLWQHADAALPGRIRGQQEVVGLERDERGATVSVTDRASGEDYQVQARYVVFADGGRVSADLLGVEMEGARAIRDVVSLYVGTDLSAWSEPDALLAHFIAPLGQGRPVGTMQALGPNRYGRESAEWLVAGSPGPGEIGEPTLDTAHRVLGVPADHEITLKAISHWKYEGVVATRFRHGPVFLAGDAAHRHPPTGGLGLNCGVQDAHNLAWKLAAVLHGHAGDALLDSYEAERRPIAAFYTAHSLENASRHAPIAAALGLRQGQSEDDGWREIAVWAGDTPEGERRRAAVAAAVASNADDYSQLGVEAGFSYETGALLPDGSPPPADHESPVAFTPTTRPGHHVPHVWLGRGADRVSTVDLVDVSGFTVFTGEAGADRWREAARTVERELGCAVTVVAVPSTADGGWAAVRGVPEDGAVLVRPDRVVAWRGAAADQLAGVLRRVLGRDGSPRPDGSAFAEPFLERIRHAAVLLRGEGGRAPEPAAVPS